MGTRTINKPGYLPFEYEFPDSMSEAAIQQRISQIIPPPSLREPAPADVTHIGFVGQGTPLTTTEKISKIVDFLDRHQADIYGTLGGMAVAPEYAMYKSLPLLQKVLAVAKPLGGAAAGGVYGQMQQDQNKYPLPQLFARAGEQGLNQAANEALGLTGVTAMRGIGRFLGRRSLAVAGGPENLKELADLMLQERKKVGAFVGTPGSKRAFQKAVFGYGPEVNAAAQEANKAGVTITSGDLAEYGIRRTNMQRIEDGRPPLSTDEEQNIIKETEATMDNILREGRRGQSNIPKIDMGDGTMQSAYTPMEILRGSRGLNQMLKNRFGVRAEFENLATSQDLRTDLQAGARKVLAPLPATSKFMPEAQTIGDIRGRISEMLDLTKAMKNAERLTPQRAYGYAVPTVGARLAGTPFGPASSLPAKEIAGLLAATALTSRKLAGRGALTLTQPALQDITRQLPRYLWPSWVDQALQAYQQP